MSRAVHDMDDNFKSAYQWFEEAPSRKVWENLQLELDKKEAGSTKSRFNVWKKASFVLLLLLITFILHDYEIIKRGSGKTNKYASFTAKSNNPPAPAVTMKINKRTQTRTLNLNQTPAVYDEALPAAIYKSFIPDNDLLNAGGNINPFPKVEYANKKDSTPTINNLPPIQKTKKSFTPYWLMAVYGSYDQAGYRLDSEDPFAVSSIRHREVHEPSFSGGFLITRQFTRHIGLQTGLVYSNTQIGISPQKMYALQLPGGDIAYKFITSIGYAYIKPGAAGQPVVGDSMTTSDAKHILSHISIPLMVKYRIGNKKFTVTPGAGIEATFITSAKVEVGLEYSSNREIVSVNKLNDTRSFYRSFTADVELKYELNKKMSLMIRPVYRQAISPIAKNNVVETFPRSFSIGAGIVTKF